MPNTAGRSHLYSDTSKSATGNALYQIQNGKPRLTAYASKRQPEAARNYSITELALCGLAINIASFSHLLKRADFNAIIDHLSLTQIIKSKAEPATIRIKRLLELISSYSFNLYYIKGKDMVLSDFLSRQNNDDNNPHEIIPISFDMHNVMYGSMRASYTFFFFVVSLVGLLAIFLLIYFPIVLSPFIIFCLGLSTYHISKIFSLLSLTRLFKSMRPYTTTTHLQVP